MWWIALPVALAQDPDTLPDGPAAPRWVRVDDPAWPGAIVTSEDGALLEAPPPPGTPWRWEADVRLDGWPGTFTRDALNADAWHDRGWRGQGVRVAIFDVHWFGAEADPAILGDVHTADCVAHVSCEVPIDTLRPRFPGQEGTHGFACAEAVRDVAPDAELFLVRVSGFTTFDNAVRWALRHDIDVISMSLSFFNTSFYDGTGPFAGAVRRLDAAGIQLVTSAGNSARQHWHGPWVDADADGRMDFDGDNQLELDLNGGGRKLVYVNWDEHGTCGDSDLAARALDPEGFVVGTADAVQQADADQCDPVERLSIATEQAGIYAVELRAKRVVRSGLWVDVITQSGAVVEAMPEASIVDPGVQPGALTVGAVRARGYLTNDVEGFSSRGPVRSLAFKPDIAGPDGLDATVFGNEGFFGTSAATPAVAGAVALVLSSDPALTPKEAAQRLQAWAWKEAPEVGRPDPRWGAGKARLPDPPDPSPGCGRGRLWAAVMVGPWWWRRRPRRG